jgi:hypothetical protein
MDPNPGFDDTAWIDPSDLILTSRRLDSTFP